MQTCSDVVGIGFGPANVALAIAIEEANIPIRARFVESQVDPVWQGGLLLDGSNVQNHACRDLATLRNPRSRYTFLNYLFEIGRLVEHLNLPTEFPLRKEYAQYVSWATHHFDHLVDYGQRAVSVAVVDHDGAPAYRVCTQSDQYYLGRTLVLGCGRTPYIPRPFDAVEDERIFHLADYLYRLQSLPDPQIAIVVIGGSQSAVEITLDLAKRFPNARIINYVRSFGPRLKDTSPFSEEGFFPQFTDYYFRASTASKRQPDTYLRPTNYSSVDADVLNQLYLMIYEQRLEGRQRVFVQNNRQVLGVNREGSSVRLQIEEVHLGGVEEVVADFVILATGFRDLGPGRREEPYPPLLSGVIDRFEFDADDRLDVKNDYSLTATNGGTPPLFINGLCETTHGIGDSGSFSLLPLRAAVIRDGLAKRLDAAKNATGIVAATPRV